VAKHIWKIERGNQPGFFEKLKLNSWFINDSMLLWID